MTNQEGQPLNVGECNLKKFTDSNDGYESLSKKNENEHETFDSQKEKGKRKTEHLMIIFTHTGTLSFNGTICVFVCDFKIVDSSDVDLTFSTNKKWP